MADVTKLGQAIGQGTADVLGAVTSPVAPLLGTIRDIIQTPEQKAAKEQQNLLKQLVNQQMNETTSAQVNPQIQVALATKDYGTASKLLSQQQQRDKFQTSIQKDKLLSSEHKQLLTDALNSGVDVKSAADLRARLALGSEAVQRKLTEEAKKPGQAAAVTTAQLQAKQALEVTPEKIIQNIKAENPNLSPEDLKKVAYGKMLERKFFSDKEGKAKFDKFWEGQQIIGNVPTPPPGILESLAKSAVESVKKSFQSQPGQQGQQQPAKPQQQPQGKILVSPSTGRRFMQNPDGSMTEIK
jgi:hypothetical protein